MMLEAFARWQRHTNSSHPSMPALAGPDEGDGFRQHPETFAEQMGLYGGVLFTGPLYGDAKWAAYRDADLFVLPSQNENFGNTAAEAIACGTPVLLTDRCGIAPIADACVCATNSKRWEKFCLVAPNKLCVIVVEAREMRVATCLLLFVQEIRR